MTPPPRVLDTNVLLSRLLMADSVSGRAARHAVDTGLLLVSDATLDELVDVLARPKFDPYVTLEERQEFLQHLLRIAERVPILRQIQACRDPRDDKFLDVAVNGQAGVIITGDRDLPALHPFRSIPILTPADYLAQVEQNR
ncbi:MAG: putative toxin-antitoxin system toxin component, PIN family [Candidatus Tectomicrobia bacterium]|nr:putative toxin-antitoxin system toxin component, PIN family [Candidatus Tectomicrobia bacterium]